MRIGVPAIARCLTFAWSSIHRPHFCAAIFLLATNSFLPKIQYSLATISDFAD